MRGVDDGSGVNCPIGDFDAWLAAAYSSSRPRVRLPLANRTEFYELLFLFLESYGDKCAE